jgi:hypothetical protein
MKHTLLSNQKREVEKNAVFKELNFVTPNPAIHTQVFQKSPAIGNSVI